MENNKRNLTDDFLMHNLSEEEQSQFDKLVKEDPEFLEKVSKEKYAMDLLKIKGSKDLFENIMKQEGDIEKQKTLKVHPFKRALLLAASIAILITLSLYYFKKESSEHSVNKNIVAEVFKPYEQIDQPVTLGETTTSLTEKKAKGYEAYDKKNYNGTIANLEKIEQKEKDVFVMFYLGNSYLALHKDEEATKIFLYILHYHKAFPLTTQTKWYLALAYIEAGKNKQAQELLKDLLNDESYSKQATDLLYKIKN